MNTELMQKIQKKYMKNVPELQVGDTVEVHTIIRDGDKQRIQKFKGLVISINGKGLDTTFTVRKISYGVGVEKIFPLHSTNISKIEVLKHANVRRSKLYYLRNRIGKAAMKLKDGAEVVPVEHAVEADELELKDEAVETEPVEEVKAESESSEK